MFERRRHKRFLRTAWLAAFAILLQALTPVMHHPAGMALAGTLSFDGAQHLCIAPGTAAPGDSDKSPAHKLPDCAICQAVHAIGGFVPPHAPVLTALKPMDVSPVGPTAISGPQSRPYSSSQPRAPPVRA